MTSIPPGGFSPDVVGSHIVGSGLSSYVIALEAWRRGLRVTFGPDHILRYYAISDGSQTVEFDRSRPKSLTSDEDYGRLNRKTEANDRLRQAGLPVPAGCLLEPETVTLEEVRKRAASLGYPLVLKPDDGSMGRGVLVGLTDWTELRSGYNYLATEFGAKKITMERHHLGDDHRFLVVGDTVVSVIRKVPAYVTGDGVSTIEELIRGKNELRRENPFLRSGPIRVDFEIRKVLEEGNLSVASVPELGAEIVLRRIANASAGGELVDVTEQIPAEVKKLAVHAAKCFPNIHVAGVDILYDVNAEGVAGTTILELNGRPHIGVNMYPSRGQGRDAPGAILDLLFPESHRSASPHVMSLRFDERAILTALRSGAFGSVSLPPLPTRCAPYRRQLVLGSARERVTLQFPATRVQVIARKWGISGGMRSLPSGELQLNVAGRNAAVIRRFIEDLQVLAPFVQLRERPWRGVVSVGFTVRGRPVDG